MLMATVRASVVVSGSLLHKRNNSCPSSTSTLDFDREACHLEPVWFWHGIQIRQFFNLAVFSSNPCKMCFPHDPPVTSALEVLSHIGKRSIKTISINANDLDPLRWTPLSRHFFGPF